MNFLLNLIVLTGLTARFPRWPGHAADPEVDAAAPGLDLPGGDTAFKVLNRALMVASLNDTASHNAFAQRHGLMFQLLSDLDGSIARA